MQTVVTYQEAYRNHYRWNLCKKHASKSEEALMLRNEAGIGPLGPVDHGEHDGYCIICFRNRKEYNETI